MQEINWSNQQTQFQFQLYILNHRDNYLRQRDSGTFYLKGPPSSLKGCTDDGKALRKSRN